MGKAAKAEKGVRPAASDPTAPHRQNGAEGPKALAAARLDAIRQIPVDRTTYETVTTKAQLQTWLDAARARGRLCFDTETDSLDAIRANLVGVALAVEPGKAAYVPLQHTTGGGLFGGSGDLQQLPLAETIAALKEVLEDASILKIGQNLKYDCLVMSRYGVRITPIDDTMLISYALDTGRGGHGMDALSERHLAHTCISFKEVIAKAQVQDKKEERTFAKVPIADATAYSAEDADITLRLWEVLKARLPADRMTTVYETLERPLLPILVEMERTGIKIDRNILARLSGEFAQGAARLEAEIQELAGVSFNLASPKQLGEFLFDTLKLPGGKKTKTGQWETRAGLLDDLAGNEEVPEDARKLVNLMVEWRQLTKLKSTYTDSLPHASEPGDGPRAHVLRAGLDDDGAPVIQRS